MKPQTQTIQSAQDVLLKNLKYEVREENTPHAALPVKGVMPQGTIVVCGECNENEDVDGTGGGSSGQCI